MDNKFVISLKIRTLIFLLLAILMFIGPFYKQVLGGDSVIFREWIMWKKSGLGIYNLKVYRKTGSGKFEALNYFDIIYGESEKIQHVRYKRIYHKKRIESILSLLCNVKFQNSYLKVTLRKYSESGWDLLYDGDGNICSNYSTVLSNI